MKPFSSRLNDLCKNSLRGRFIRGLRLAGVPAISKKREPKNYMDVDAFVSAT